MKPLIGITMDYSTQGTYSVYPWYALRKEYADVVENMGAIPIMIPYAQSVFDEYVKLCDGFIFPGGDVDIPPEYYGDKKKSDTVITVAERTNFELRLMNAIIKSKKPLLGICAGQQLMNVYFKGTLIQHIPNEVLGYIEHNVTGNNKKEAAHEVNIVKDTLLHSIIKKDVVMVNSTHHQAVKKPGKAVQVNAMAPDGVIEGIEMTSHPFCLGVEWHPEYLSSNDDEKIFAAFIEACVI